MKRFVFGRRCFQCVELCQQSLALAEMARLVVSTRSLEVLASDRGIFTMLGYHPHEMNCQSILTFTGKRSDPRLLQSAIESMQGDKMQIILYDASGGERRLIISCSQYHNACVSDGCLINLYPSEAITLQDALTDSSRACTLISADAPHAIHMANDAFLDRFACSRSEVLGRPLHFFYGDSDLESLAPLWGSDSDAASALLCAAKEGRVARRSPGAPDDFAEGGGADDDVTCVPVVEAPNGPIRHLLITFGPLQALGSADDDCRLSSASRTAHRRARLRAQQGGGPIAVKGLSLRGSGATVVPRRKPGPDGLVPPAVPVILTQELLAGLADLPLQKAASAAGISPTAFKKACRRLGISRWAYKRCRSADAPSAAVASAPGAEVFASGARMDGAGCRFAGTDGGDGLDPTRHEPVPGGPPSDDWDSAWQDDPWAGLADAILGGDSAAAASPAVGGLDAASEPASASSCGPSGGSVKARVALDGLFQEAAAAADEAAVRGMLDEAWLLQS